MTRSPHTRRRFCARLAAAAAAAGGAAPLLLAGEGSPEPRAAGATVRLLANENPLGMSPRALAAAESAAGTSHRYPSSRAARDLRAAIAARLGVDPRHVAVGAGSMELLRVAATAFAGLGRARVVAPALTVEAIVQYARPFTSNVVRVPGGPDLSVPLAELRRAAGDEAALVYVVNPCNPTGLSYAVADLETLAASLPARSLLVVDEAYVEFADGGLSRSAVPLVAKGLPVLVTRSFSKAHGMAGFRVGYGVAAPATLARLLPLRTVAAVSRPAVAAALASLEDAEFVERTVAFVRRGRVRLRDGLAALGLRPLSSETNFVFFDCGEPAEALRAALRRHRILAGRPFPAAPNWLRVSVGTEADVEAFLAAVREIRSGGEGRSKKG